MYSGVVDTIAAGFAAAGVRVSRGAGLNDDRNRFPKEGPATLAGNLSMLTERDVFVWVGEYIDALLPWKELGQRGVRRIHYQTEPAQDCLLAWDKAYVRHFEETWHYSYHNLDGCDARIARFDKIEARRNLLRPLERRNATRPTLRRFRYVPVGSSPHWVAAASRAAIHTGRAEISTGHAAATSRAASSGATSSNMGSNRSSLASCFFFLGNPQETGGSRTGGRRACFARFVPGSRLTVRLTQCHTLPYLIKCHTSRPPKPQCTLGVRNRVCACVLQVANAARPSSSQAHLPCVDRRDAATPPRHMSHPPLAAQELLRPTQRFRGSESREAARRRAVSAHKVPSTHTPRRSRTCVQYRMSVFAWRIAAGMSSPRGHMQPTRPNSEASSTSSMAWTRPPKHSKASQDRKTAEDAPRISRGRAHGASAAASKRRPSFVERVYMVRF